MEYVIVNKDNLDEENICCAIAKNNDIQVLSKKNWLNNMFDEGLVFLKAKERGKCFIALGVTRNIDNFYFSIPHIHNLAIT